MEMSTRDLRVEKKIEKKEKKEGGRREEVQAVTYIMRRWIYRPYPCIKAGSLTLNR